MVDINHYRKEKLEPEKTMDTEFLHLNLIRIDLLIRVTVRRWELAGQDFSEKFRGLFISEKNIQDLLNLPIGGNWGTGISLPENEEQLIDDLFHQVEEEIVQLREKADTNEIFLRLDQLKHLFNLSEFELDAFLLCLLPMLDTRYERIYGFLHDDITNKFISAGLIFDLLIEPGLDRIEFFKFFEDQHALLKYELIKSVSENQSSEKPLIKQNFIVPNEIISWLMGQYKPVKKLSNALRLSFSDQTLNDRSDFFDLPEDLSILMSKNPFLVLFGQDDLQKQLIANHIADLKNQSLLYFDLRMISDSIISEKNLFDLFFRDVKLSGSIPAVIGWDNYIENQNEVQILFQELSNFDESIILFTSKNWPILRNESQKQKPIIWLNCNHPSSGKRLQIWKRYLGKSEEITDRELEMLSGQFSLTASQIQNTVYSAKDLAFKKDLPISIDDLYESARFYSSHHLSSLATKIHPRYGWEDIVLPEDGLASLQEITNTIRWRTVVLDEWGVGARLMPYAGVSVLFAGPPGTGKTLAAQVIAAELKMDLYKIDLSTVVSKYIGETEKNLERIFSQAKNSNAILFFDEADSIFGKRSEVKDAHDRYANIEVGYLLQRMETYDGVVILATNLRSNMDDAFTRRIQFIVEFPFPDEQERKRIWEVLFPPGVPRSDDIDFDELGFRFRLTGGSIRNVIISASFLAASDNQSVSNHHLIHAIRREMQKMGRLVNDKDLIMPHKEGNNGKKSN